MDGYAVKDWKRQVTSEDFQREFNDKSIRIGLTETSFSNKSRFIGIQDDNDSSQYYKPFDNNTQPKYKSLVLTVLIVSCLITLAVALAVLFTSSKHSPESETVDLYVSAEGQISLNETFTSELNDKKSHRYLDFKRNFTQSMSDILRKDFNFRGCEISHVRNGSIKVDFVLFLDLGGKSISAESLKEVIRTSYNVQNGRSYFGTLSVNIGTLSISNLKIGSNLKQGLSTVSSSVTSSSTTLQTSNLKVLTGAMETLISFPVHESSTIENHPSTTNVQTTTDIVLTSTTSSPKTPIKSSTVGNVSSTSTTGTSTEIISIDTSTIETPSTTLFEKSVTSSTISIESSTTEDSLSMSSPLTSPVESLSTEISSLDTSTIKTLPSDTTSFETTSTTLLEKSETSTITIESSTTEDSLSMSSSLTSPVESSSTEISSLDTSTIKTLPSDETSFETTSTTLLEKSETSTITIESSTTEDSLSMSSPLTSPVESLSTEISSLDTSTIETLPSDETSFRISSSESSSSETFSFDTKLTSSDMPIAITTA